MTNISREELRLLIAEVTESTVEKTFLRLGVKIDDPIEVQKDFQHLREWRVTVSSLKMKAIVAALGIVVAGALGTFWIGLRRSLGL